MGWTGRAPSDNDLYFRYLDRVHARGIDIPIVRATAGQNFNQTRAFALRCGASIPPWLADRFAGLDQTWRTASSSAMVAAEQVFDLVDRGVPDFQFYTMNRADLVYAICHLLGLRPAEAPVAGVVADKMKALCGLVAGGRYVGPVFR